MGPLGRAEKSGALRRKGNEMESRFFWNLAADRLNGLGFRLGTVEEVEEALDFAKGQVDELDAFAWSSCVGALEEMREALGFFEAQRG